MMTVVFLILVVTMIMFIWGKIRYDFVALLALFTVTVLGIISPDTAFDGFGHPAVITVAAVMIISKGLQNSGLIDMITRQTAKIGDNLFLQIVILSTITAITSAFMNNVGALAIMMPVAINMVRKKGISPSYILMPLAFASLLGGMMTLIGTPPNIIIATFRQDTTGESFRMFSFMPVGISVVLAGIIFISLIGWRLIPKRKSASGQQNMFEIEDYITEVLVTEESKLIGSRINELNKLKDIDINILSIIRNRKQMQLPPPLLRFQAGDILVIEADSEDLKSFLDMTGFKLAEGKEIEADDDEESEIIIKEVVIMKNSRLIGRTAAKMNMRNRFGINLLAVARRDKKIRKRLGEIRFAVGDVLLLQGKLSFLDDTVDNIGCLPLANRDLRIGSPQRVWMSLAIFGFSIAMVVTGLLPVQISFALAALFFVLTNLISFRETYNDIDWSVIVLLAAMIPVGTALEKTGGTVAIAEIILNLGDKFPLWFLMFIIMVVTMGLSNVINNAATAILMAPIGIVIASELGITPDPILMCIAVAASSPFLTPIGHQSNTLVMAPGGYKFSDYWKMGLPLSIIIIIVSIPMILMIWKP